MKQWYEASKSPKHADYEIVQIDQDKIFIVDLDLGNISVTNDAEYVYLEIYNNFPGKRLIYRDTLGNWDEIVITNDNQRKINFFTNDIFPATDLCNQRKINFLYYTGPVPDESKITGCPSSAFMTRSSI